MAKMHQNRAKMHQNRAKMHQKRVQKGSKRVLQWCTEGPTVVYSGETVETMARTRTTVCPYGSTGPATPHTRVPTTTGKVTPWCMLPGYHAPRESTRLHWETMADPKHGKCQFFMKLRSKKCPESGPFLVSKSGVLTKGCF